MSIRQREPIQHFILQQQILTLRAGTKHRRPCSLDSTFQLVPIPLDHQLVQIGDGFRILADLGLGGWVEDGQPCVHVPFVRVDAQRDIDLDVLDTPDPAGHVPGKLVVGTPCRAHAQERSMCDGLRIGCDSIVEFAGQVDVFRPEA